MTVDLEAAGSAGCLRDGIGNIGATRIPTHGGVRRQQQTQLVQGMLTAADQNDRTAGDIDEDREESHTACPENLKIRRIIYRVGSIAQQKE